MTFNVLTEPWIPLSNGEMVSLMAALEHAHEIEGIECTNPTETVAVYRLITAFLMDALTLPSLDERLELLEQGHFDMVQIHAYVSQCERKGTSFDLFDPEHPFMQAAYDPKLDKEPRPAAIMALQMPSGNNHVFFDHQPEACFTPGEALRKLLASYLFCTAAAQGYPSSVNNTPCVYVLHHADTLMESLVLNMVSIAECGNIGYGKPAWRQAGAVIPKSAFANVDMLEALTWQPRRVTLIADDDGMVRRVYWQQGRNFKGNALWRDPHVPYRKLKSGEYAPVRPQPGRAYWRDLGALAASREGKGGDCIQPAVLANAPEDRPVYRLNVVGVITNQAALLDLSTEEMNIPQSLLVDEMRGDVLRKDLLFFEDCAQALRTAAGNFQDGKLAPFLLESFFALTHDYIFNRYLGQLSLCEEDEQYIELRDQVHEQALRMMLASLDREKLRLGSDGRMLRAQAEMRKTAIAIYYRRRKERERNGSGSSDDTAAAASERG